MAVSITLPPLEGKEVQKEPPPQLIAKQRWCVQGEKAGNKVLLPAQLDN